jgi:hypothetical protein
MTEKRSRTAQMAGEGAEMARDATRRRGAAEQTPASSTGRHEAHERRQETTWTSSPPCRAPGSLLNGGEGTMDRVLQRR